MTEPFFKHARMIRGGKEVGSASVWQSADNKYMAIEVYEERTFPTARRAMNYLVRRGYQFDQDND